ncbi:hypothetical protein BT96DRAFT_512890 [Gymnopus androsaceus JB14]|uniref:Uncharacterized protein n=1 Tax=Gymnopus androsaceus JB14 TaxID=1447944 RepID=A0A6A4GML7_9AGAR|nr:hypothetical protein BT96DRAFT_512890 [Gymnopus androsaceus JB14]
MAQYLSLRRIEGPISLTPAEIFFLRHQLSETEDQKAVLEKEIKSFDSDDLEIQLLDIQKNVKEKAITSLRNVLSPIRRIPPEILFKILQFSCLPEDGMYKADCEVTRRTFTISGVCVAWRKAAHANPLMWTEICIDFEEVKKDRLFMELMDQWMARSRGLPLDFYLDDLEAWFVRRILNFRLQMRSLYLKGQDFVSYFPFFHLPPSSLPLLEEVYFASTGFDSKLKTSSIQFPMESRYFLQHRNYSMSRSREIQ